MGSIEERILQIINDNELNVSSFAKKLGTSRQTIDNYIRHGRAPSFDIIVKILEEFPKIDANWLLTGEGNMSISEAQNNAINNASDYALLLLKMKTGGSEEMNLNDVLFLQILERLKSIENRLGELEKGRQ